MIAPNLFAISPLIADQVAGNESPPCPGRQGHRQRWSLGTLALSWPPVSRHGMMQRAASQIAGGLFDKRMGGEDRFIEHMNLPNRSRRNFKACRSAPPRHFHRETGQAPQRCRLAFSPKNIASISAAKNVRQFASLCLFRTRRNRTSMVVKPADNKKGASWAPFLFVP